MSGPDVVKNNIEDIFKVFKDAGIHPKVAALIVQQHEEILTLQQYCKELSNHMSKIIDALKLSNQLHRQHKTALDRINSKFQDPYLNDVKAEQMNDPD